MEYVLALVESEQEADRFDPDAYEVEYYNECEAAFNDEIIGVVLSQEETETPSYEQDAYPEIDTDSDEFDDIREMWCGEFTPSISEKMEMEGKFFTGSDWHGNIHGFNPDPGRVHPAAAREMLRRPTSDAPNHQSKESLGVLVRKSSEIMKK